jgi:hypothetical protein
VDMISLCKLCLAWEKKGERDIKSGREREEEEE